jgi:L-malate glycosyltransferase
MVNNTQKNKGWLMLLPWQISGGISAGGVNQVVLNLYDEMDRVGSFNPFLMEDNWQSAQVKEVDLDGRRLLSLRHRVPTGGGKAFLMFCLMLPLSLYRSYQCLKSYNIRIVNAHYPSLAVINYLILMKLRIADIRVILSVHGRDIREVAEYKGVCRFLYLQIYKRATLVVACSHGLLDDVNEIVEIDPTRQCVVHNGINSTEYKIIAAQAEIDIEPGSYLLNIGTYEHKKGHDVLLKAFQLIASRNESIKLLIAGRHTPYYQETIQLVHDLGLENRVDLLFDLEHQVVAGLLKHARMFVLSSRNEGFAISLLEAGALRKTIVATDVCGVAELIDDGEDGFLVSTEDYRTLAEKVMFLLGDSAIADQFAGKLHDKVQNNFSWTAALVKYESFASSNYLR